MEKAGVVDELGDPVQVDDIVGLRLNVGWRPRCMRGSAGRRENFLSGIPAANLLFEDLTIDAMAYFSLQLVHTTDIPSQRLAATLLQLSDFRADLEASWVVEAGIHSGLPEAILQMCCSIGSSPRQNAGQQMDSRFITYIVFSHIRAPTYLASRTSLLATKNVFPTGFVRGRIVINLLRMPLEPVRTPRNY